MNTDLLRTFIEVARQESYTRAATVLHLSQPAVYQHVKHLEQELGATLVYQSGKRVLLTIEGRVALEHAVEIVRQLDYLCHATLEDVKELRAGRISIVAGTTPGQSVVPGAIAALLRAYPQLQVRMTIQSSWTEMSDALLRLGYDVAISSVFTPDSRLEPEKLLRDELVAIHPPGTSVADSPESFDSLLSYPFMGYDPTLHLRRVIDEWASEREIRLASSLEVGSQNAVMAAVLGGDGFGIVSKMICSPLIKSGLLGYTPLCPPLYRELYFIRPSNIPVPRVIAVLPGIIREVASSMAF